jgi:addiction module HigA family antidote
MTTKLLPPVHPGAFVKELIQEYGMSMYGLAKALAVNPIRIVQIVHGKRAVTPDTAMRLAIYFGGDAQSWVNWQAQYDLKLAQQKYAKELERQIQPFALAV